MLQNPGGEYVRNRATLTYPDVHMILNATNNVASHQQDTNELLRALQKVRTVVCVDPWWTASARFSDIMLPATTTLERNEISSGGTCSKDKVYAMKKVIEPLGESLDDWEIFRRLAEIFDVAQQFTDGWEVMDLVKASYSKSTAAEVMDFEESSERGVVRIPEPREERD